MINLNDFKQELTILKSFWGNSFEEAGSTGHRYYHSVRVAETALQLALKMGFEPTKNFIAAALFHDIGKAERVDHNNFLDGSQKADETLGKHDSLEFVEIMVDKYLTDLYSTEDRKEITNLVVSKDDQLSHVISDADNLDEVGLINIWKMFTYSGCKRISIEDTVNYFFSNELSRLKSKMETELFLQTSKEISENRIDLMTKFFENFKSEILTSHS